MKISFSSPVRINDSLSPNDAELLSSDELRLTIPSDVSFVEGDLSLQLRDVALLGLVEQLVDACERLRRGESRARMLDIYGEYELEFHCDGDGGVLEEKLSKQSIRSSKQAFFSAVAQASQEAFDAVSANMPAIASNSAFIAFRAACDAFRP